MLAHGLAVWEMVGQLPDKLPDAPGLPWARYALALQVPLP